MVPSTLLLHYFELAQQHLAEQRWLIDDDEDDDKVGEISGGGEIASSNKDLNWHRSKIVETQLASLDETISKWQQQQQQQDDGSGNDNIISRESIQGVLRQIGQGDFSCVSYYEYNDVSSNNNDQTSESAPATSGIRSRSARSSGSNDASVGSQGVTVVTNNDEEQQQQLLSESVERTNEVARRAFSKSILIISEWRLHVMSQAGDGSCSNNCIDDKSILEYCGLIMAAVRLPEMQQYLQTGNVRVIHSSLVAQECGDDDDTSTVEERLLRIQQIYWCALGYDDPNNAMNQLKCILLGEDAAADYEHKVMEALTQYASAMTVAVTNANMSREYGSMASKANNDDGTTRIVSVSYSEKIITGNNITDANSSMSAPTSERIDEHTTSQERQEFDTARAASMLQQQLWDNFQSLSIEEQKVTIERAKIVHDELMEKLANTPPGQDRVVLMQSMDGEMQRLLVIYKLWSSG